MRASRMHKSVLMLSPYVEGWGRSIEYMMRVHLVESFEMADFLESVSFYYGYRTLCGLPSLHGSFNHICKVWVADAADGIYRSNSHM